MAMTDDERDIEMLKLITGAEHHFNNLCFNIRALASTWLLATLAGVGWILKDLPARSAAGDFAIDKVELLMLLCIASSVGIFVLWIMDILVYTRLLNVWFDARVKYEITDDLPAIRLNMKKLFDTGRASELIMFFYLALVAAPLCLGMYVAKSAGEQIALWSTLGILALLLTVIVAFSPRDKEWRKKKKQALDGEDGSGGES